VRAIDRFYQLGYKGAYWMMRGYWAVRRPDTHGALVAVWHGGRVLLARNSYHRYYCFPGGYVRSGETSRQAARRELAEEVGVAVPEERLALGHEVTHEWESKHDHVEIFEIDLAERPTIEVDNREVIAADFIEPNGALELELFPPVREYLLRKRAN
jgi:8-oxo-dGTP diphosphatase